MNREEKAFFIVATAIVRKVMNRDLTMQVVANIWDN
jgi:hypothetical protein